MPIGFSAPELTQRLFMYGADLDSATISGSIATGPATGQVVITVAAVDGGDAVANGDGLGEVLSIRYRTSDGIWHDLPDVVADDYTVTVDPIFEGLVINMWVQVQGTIGFGQTFMDTVGVPGTHIELEDVEDTTIPVTDAAVSVTDAEATTIPPA